MSRVKLLKDPYLKDDFETGRKGTKKAGRKRRKKVFRALRKAINRMLNKQDAE
jgi:hypothetical protein